METKQSLSVKVENGIKEVVIRNGEAAKIHEPLILGVSGTIKSPAEFWAKRSSLYKAEECHIEFNKLKGEIKLILNEKDYFGGEVKGSIEINPELAEFGINKEKMRTTKEMSQFLKMRKAFFSDADEAVKIIGNLQKYKAKVETQIDKMDSTRGDKKDNFEVKVDSDIDLNFTLKMPIYKGFKDFKFLVEICLDVRDKALTLWLESAELQQIITGTRDEIFSDELKNFESLVCIEQ